MPTVPILGTFADASNTALGFRNKIINGGFDIWQRGTSQPNGTNGYGCADRWLNSGTGSGRVTSQQIFTIGQSSVPGNPSYFFRNVITSVSGAANYAFSLQRMESVKTLAGQTCTLSFWAKADASRNIATEFTQYFGSGGSADVLSINVKTHALTTSWQKFTTTFVMPSISGKTLGTDKKDCVELIFWWDAGSNFNARTNSLGNQSGTFDIANVQVEAGAVDTPFETRPIGLELSLCQRYYWRSEYEADKMPALGWAVDGTYAYVVIPLPVSMRIKPNISINSMVFANNNSSVVTGVTGVQANLSDISYISVLAISSGLTAKEIYRFIANSSGKYIDASAEL